MLWFNSAGSSALHSHLLTSLHSWMRERIEKGKSVRICGIRWKTVGQERKKERESKQEKKKTGEALCNCSPPAEWCPACSWAMVAPPSQLLPLLLLRMLPHGMGHPCGPFVSAVLAVTPLSLWCILNLLTGGAAWEAEKALSQCKKSCTTAETLVCCHHYSYPKSKMQHHTNY